MRTKQAVLEFHVESLDKSEQMLELRVLDKRTGHTEIYGLFEVVAKQLRSDAICLTADEEGRRMSIVIPCVHLEDVPADPVELRSGIGQFAVERAARLKGE